MTRRDGCRLTRRHAWPTVASLIVACNSPQGPLALGEQVLIAGGDSARMYAVDIAQRGVVASTVPIPRYQDAWARSRDSQVLYVSAFDQIPSRQLIAIDRSSLRVVWQEAMTTLALRSQIGSIAISGNYALSISPDGGRLLVADAQHDTAVGIAVLDGVSRDPIGFIGPMAVSPGGMAVLPPGPGVPNGVVLIAGSRQNTSPSTGELFVLDGATLVVTDSVAITPNVGATRGGLSQVALASDLVHAYVLGTDSVYQYDLGARAITATAPRLGSGQLGIAPDGLHIYLADAGDGRNQPGSGKVFVYDANLALLAPIDLSAAAVNGVAPVTRSVAVSATGDQLYVLAGTPQFGPLFGSQPSRVLDVSLGSGALVGTIPLGEYGVQWMFLR
jgi:hypothetical protein